MTDTPTCSDCGTELDRPLPDNANYVVSTRHSETEEVEVVYAMVHTEETKKRLNELDRKLPNRNRQAINAEMANPDAPETVEVPKGTKEREDEDGGYTVTAEREETKFSIPVEKFDHVEVESPEVVKESDDIAYTYTEVEEREVQKTGLVCSDCTDADDEILWGVDDE